MIRMPYLESKKNFERIVITQKKQKDIRDYF